MQQLQGELFTKRVINTLLQDAEELSCSFGQPKNESKKIGIENIGAMSGTIIGKLRYP
jgi:hypothetical protein